MYDEFRHYCNQDTDCPQGLYCSEMSSIITPDHKYFRDVIVCGEKRPEGCIDNKVSYRNENYEPVDGQYMETYKCTQPNGEPRPEFVPEPEAPIYNWGEEFYP